MVRTLLLLQGAWLQSLGQGTKESRMPHGCSQKNKSLKLIVGGGGINEEFAINRYTLLHIKQINKDQLYSTGNYIQYLIITKNLKKNIDREIDN